MIQQIRELLEDPVGHFRWWREKWERTLRQRELVRLAQRTLRAQQLDGDPGAEVHVLVGHRLIGDCLWAVWSLYRFLPARYPLVVHDDGTLTGADADLLRSLFQGCRILAKEEADSAVNDELSTHNLPRCLEYRQSHVLGMKLFDVQLFSAGRRALFMDVDVLVLDDPLELVQYLCGDVDAAVARYNEDVDDWYAWPLSRLDGVLANALHSRVNTGLMCFSCLELDWERYEEWLLQLGEPTSLHHVEQTLWALGFSQGESLPLPPRYDVHHRFAWQGVDRDVALRTRNHGRPVITQHYSGSWDYRAMFYDAIRRGLD